MKISLDDFREKYFSPIAIDYMEKLAMHFIESQTVIFARLKEQMQLFMRFIATVQEKKIWGIGEIQISILYSSVLLGTPEMCVSVYDEDGVLGKEIISAKYNMDWMFQEWDVFEKKVQKQISELSAEHSIPKAAVQKLMLECLNGVIKEFALLTKYHFREIDKWDGFENLNRSEKFIVTVGSYRDWANIVYEDAFVNDIVIEKERNDFSFINLSNVRIQNKRFTNKNFRMARFSKCVFANVEFEGDCFDDVLFSECMFRNCIFKKVTFYGAIFEKCDIYKNQCYQVYLELQEENFQKEKRDDGRYITELYRPTEFKSCNGDGSIFEMR